MELQLNAYKNIIFDLGGVILNINYHLIAAAFKELGISNFEELFSQAKQQDLFDKYEKGQITTIEFRAQINKLCNNELNDEQIDVAWNAILLDLPSVRLKILEKAKKKYRTFLLSNTTELHILAFNNYLKDDLGVDDFTNYFEKTYLSYEIGMRKPDREIFEFVLNENNLNKKETLFIDDSIQHIESAAKLGIQTYWLDLRKETLEDLFI